MQRILQPTLIVLLCAIAALAQDNDQWPPLDYLRNDYRATSVVAHVRVREAEMVGGIGSYENWKVICQIVESFKGKHRTGEEIE